MFLPHAGVPGKSRLGSMCITYLGMAETKNSIITDKNNLVKLWEPNILYNYGDPLKSNKRFPIWDHAIYVRGHPSSNNGI